MNTLIPYGRRLAPDGVMSADITLVRAAAGGRHG